MHDLPASLTGLAATDRQGRIWQPHGSKWRADGRAPERLPMLIAIWGPLTLTQVEVRRG